MNRQPEAVFNLHRYYELMAEIWKNALDPSIKDEKKLIQTLLDMVGPALDVCRATYLTFCDDKNCFITDLQWHKDQFGSSLGENISWEEAQHFKGREFIELPGDISKLPTTSLVKQAVSDYFVDKLKKYKTKSYLIIPHGNLQKPKGLFSFSDCEQKRIWTDVDKKILAEMVNIVTIKSDQWHAESSLARSEAFNRGLVEASPVGILYLNTQGLITYENPAMKRMMGVPGGMESPVLGMNVADIPPVQEAGARPLIERLLSGEVLEGEVIRYTSLIGKKVDLDICGAPLRDSKGNIEGALIMAHDETERKKAEQALKLNEERLEALLALTKMTQASESELTEFALEEGVRLTGSQIGFLHFLSEDQKSIQSYSWSEHVRSQCDIEEQNHSRLENAGIWADCFRRGKPVVHNDYSLLEEKTGCPKGHIPIVRHMSLPVVEGGKIVAVAGVGNKQEPYDHTDIRQLSLFMNSMWEILKRKRSEEELKKYQQTLEHRVVRRTEKLRNVNRSLKKEVNERHKIEHEVKKLNSKLRAKIRELESVNRELEAFSYSVSHDLRAPLRAIDGFTRILQEDHADTMGAEGKRILGIIAGNATKMGRLIDDLLNLARLGQQEIRIMAVEMDTIARAAFDESTQLEQDRIVKLNIEELPPAWGDPIMIREVFINLFSNALKFSRPKEASLIEVGSRPGDKETVYYVKDNGVGFDMAYASTIFKIFNRLHKDEEFEGTGVGLAIVERILHRLGGRTWAEGHIGEGSTFYFSLPSRKYNPDDTTINGLRGTFLLQESTSGQKDEKMKADSIRVE